MLILRAGYVICEFENDRVFENPYKEDKKLALTSSIIVVFILILKEESILNNLSIWILFIAGN
jgi:hypothetical protein